MSVLARTRVLCHAYWSKRNLLVSLCNTRPKIWHLCFCEIGRPNLTPTVVTAPLRGPPNIDTSLRQRCRTIPPTKKRLPAPSCLGKD